MPSLCSQCPEDATETQVMAEQPGPDPGSLNPSLCPSAPQSPLPLPPPWPPGPCLILQGEQGAAWPVGSLP